MKSGDSSLQEGLTRRPSPYFNERYSFERTRWVQTISLLPRVSCCTPRCSARQSKRPRLSGWNSVPRRFWPDMLRRIRGSSASMSVNSRASSKRVNLKPQPWIADCGIVGTQKATAASMKIFHQHEIAASFTRLVRLGVQQIAPVRRN